MTENKIWESFSFSDEKQKSAFDYLSDLKQGLVKQTGGELILETEAVDAYVDGNPPRPAAIYKLFVVAPKLGNFRRKILTVAEFSDQGRFPVDIVNHFNSDDKISSVPENQFNKEISDILTSPLVKNSIENLYQLSKEHDQKNS